MRPVPPEFVARMAPLLGDDLDAFLAALAQPRVRGLRLNPAKTDADELRATLVPVLTPVPWCPTGFTFDGAPLGGHPAHVAGLFYLQEPSAMLVAQALDPRPGDRVADLAAAPGGKTTHLAALVGPAGMVFANEFTASRLTALHATLDLWGGPGVVTSSRPIEALAGEVEPFDGVVLDAPCSGEGLFRRRPAAVRNWSPGAVAGSARRQARLLAAAAQLVRPGGVLVYSTCTFNREENEDRVIAFLADHPEWTVEPLDAPVSPGVDGPGARIWPHLCAGEGQYVARLRAPDDHHAPSVRMKKHEQDPAVRAAWADFVRTSLAGPLPFDGDLIVRGDTVYLGPSRPGVDPRLLARPGLPLGRARPGRFEPSAALATTLTPADAVRTVHFGDEDPALRAYLTGNTVQSPGPDGWSLVCWGRHPLGWGRRTGGVLKNALPEHARRMAG
jgi:16S rRNA C967 or C1407 C5-methylase (RsmB/RsmF family)/NOL1/NOP2/fmu family ribosome biogenesis protein